MPLINIPVLYPGYHSEQGHVSMYDHDHGPENELHLGHEKPDRLEQNPICVYIKNTKYMITFFLYSSLITANNRCVGALCMSHFEVMTYSQKLYLVRL